MRERTQIQRSSARAAGPSPLGVGAARIRSGPAAVPSIVDETLTSPGRALDLPLRVGMESRFGYDLSGVRVHTDDKAAHSALALGTRAYSAGQHVVFGPGRYQPSSPSGARLLAHELAHVVQAKAHPRPEKRGAEPSDAPSHAGAESQARRFAGRALAGLPLQEAPVPVAGILCAPPSGEAEDVSGSVERPERKSMAELLVEWSDAGLLDPPYRPPSVESIPPMEITEEHATTMGIAGTAPAGAAAPKVAEGAKAAARPALRVIQGGASATAPKPVPGLGLGPLAVGIAAGITAFLWPQQAGPRWMTDINPITGEPYGSPEELEWVRRLSPDQRDYLGRLSAARRLRPAPEVEDDPDPTQEPRLLPELEPAPEPQEERRDCSASNVRRRGGHKRHDAYATKVTKSTMDYFVWPGPPMRGITYDGRTPESRVVWEVKVGYGWFFNAKKRWLADKKLAHFDAQKNLGMDIARRCGYQHIWSIPDRSVARLLNERWGGVPPVWSVKE